MNDLIEKKAQEIKKLQLYKNFYKKKQSSCFYFYKLLENAKVIKSHQNLIKILKISKKNQDSGESKNKNFSIFIKKKKDLSNKLEKAISEIDKCCEKQEFRLEYLKKILSEHKLALRDFSFYTKDMTPPAKKQLRYMSELIKSHYGETLENKVVDLSSKKEKPIPVKNGGSQTEREYFLNRITDFNISK